MIKSTPGALGEWKYTVEHKRGFGTRVVWDNPPPAGTPLLDFMGEQVTVDEVGVAGMLYCTRQSDGFQNGYFPDDLEVPE